MTSDSAETARQPMPKEPRTFPVGTEFVNRYRADRCVAETLCVWDGVELSGRRRYLGDGDTHYRPSNPGSITHYLLPPPAQQEEKAECAACGSHGNLANFLFSDFDTGQDVTVCKDCVASRSGDVYGEWQTRVMRGIRARRAQPPAPQQVACPGCAKPGGAFDHEHTPECRAEHDRACGVKPAPAEPKLDKYAVHRRDEAYANLELWHQSGDQQAARKRLIAALAAELAEPTSAKRARLHPHEGRSDRVYERNRK